MRRSVASAAIAVWVGTGVALSWSTPSAFATLASPADDFADVLAAALTLAGLALHLWLSLGAALSLLSTGQRWTSALASRAADLVVPRWWRRAVCSAIGSAVVAVPLVGLAPAAVSAAPLDDTSSSGPSLAGLPYPDRPLGAIQAPRPTATVVVRPGDTLWEIAADQLGRRADVAAIAATWPAWYRANRRVVGPDPDLILAGTSLVAPPHFPSPRGHR